MPLQGNLKDMSLANLIQVNCQEMRSARLALSHQGQTAEVFIADGQVIHARSGSEQGESVVYEALCWDDGTFTLDLDVAAPMRTIQIPWNVLLLEGMKRAAQAQAKKSATRDSLAYQLEIVQRLKKIEGVAGVVVASSDGIVLHNDQADSDGEREAAVAVLIGNAARQISESLQLGNFQHGIVFWQKQRALILQTMDRYYGLDLGEHGSPALVANAAAQIVK